MALISDYNTLVQALIDTTEDDGSEFAAYIPTAVALAEDRLIRDIDWPELDSDTTGFITTTSSGPLLPTDWEYIKFVQIKVGQQRKLLRRKSDDFLIDYWPDETQQDEPKYYSLNADTGRLKVAPNPDQTYEYLIRSVNKPPRLSTTNQTNIFMDKAPEVLFNACMCECARFLKMWQQVQIWEQIYQERAMGWMKQTQRQRRDDGDTPQNPEGGQNTALHTEIGRSTS
jgi:hypothetical protein